MLSHPAVSVANLLFWLTFTFIFSVFRHSGQLFLVDVTEHSAGKELKIGLKRNRSSRLLEAERKTVGGGERVRLSVYSK